MAEFYQIHGSLEKNSIVVKEIGLMQSDLLKNSLEEMEDFSEGKYFCFGMHLKREMDAFIVELAHKVAKYEVEKRLVWLRKWV